MTEGYLAMAATPKSPILRLVVLYSEQLPPDDQKVHDASTRLPKINSPGTSANRQMNISWVEFSCRIKVHLDSHSQSLVLLINTTYVDQQVSNLKKLFSLADYLGSPCPWSG